MRERLLAAENVTAVEWADGKLSLLDQRELPLRSVWLICTDVEGVLAAIRDRVVDGASSVGIAAAYGAVLAARQVVGNEGRQEALEADMERLAETRPELANLRWALNRIRDRLARLKSGGEIAAVLEAEAIAIHQSDREANLTMAQLGVEMIRKRQTATQNLMTLGDTGALATGGFGTALGVIRAAHVAGLIGAVYVAETRPNLQGARLAAWELHHDKLDVHLLSDSAAAPLMKQSAVTWVIVGADRILANGDIVNSVGTYQLAVTAMHHGVRFMVVAASSTIDLDTESGDDLTVEDGDPDRVRYVGEQRIAPVTSVFNPAFDITPADLVDVIVTERGVVERPDSSKMAALMSRKRLH